jgi:hypothetical protein
VLERMMAAVHRYEGTVNQVMGNGAEGNGDHWRHTPCLWLWGRDGVDDLSQPVQVHWLQWARLV